MNQPSGASLPARKWKGTASIFVDYDNLFDTLEDRNVDAPEHSIQTLLSNLVRNIRSEDDAEVVRCSAYADFADLPNGVVIQQALLRLGCRPCFVDKEVQLNASEVQLCIETIAESRGTPADLIVIVSGSRQYLPILQALRADGRRVKLVALVSPNTRALAGLERQSFMHAARMLGPVAVPEEDYREDDRPTASDSLQSRTAVEYRAVDDPSGLRTLKIVEEYFGQYDEVYLTPLLRKLSALLQDDDPKRIISDLEGCGAVWLEKRHGFPYDYTVLVVDEEHPTVLRIRDELHRRYDDFDNERHNERHSERQGERHSERSSNGGPARRHQSTDPEMADHG
jgi:hypothetical protein